MGRTLTACIFLSLITGSLRAEEPTALSPVILDGGGTDGNRFALEYSAIARDGGREVIAMWMKHPPVLDPLLAGPVVFRLGYAADFALSWTFTDIHGTQEETSEQDPMTAWDPRTGKLFVGGKGVARRIFVAREKDNPPGEFEEPVDALVALEGVDKPWMAAGPLPEDPNATRIYVAGGLGTGELMWSIDLNTTWSAPIDAEIIWPLPRISSDGDLYIADARSNFVWLTRSTEIDGSGAPILSAHQADELDPDVAFPSNFRVPRLPVLVVHPTDSKKVYLVWHERTFGGLPDNVNVDLYFTLTTDATATPIRWDSDPTTPLVDDPPKIIPGGVAVPGDQFFPWLEIDDDGGLHLLFMDSRHNPDQPDHDLTDPHGLFDYYYAYSADEGATWTEIRLTAQSFEVADAFTSLIPQFWGDYLGMAVSGNHAYCFYALPAGNPVQPECTMSHVFIGTPATLADFNIDFGSHSSGNLASLVNPDDNRLEVNGAQIIPTAPVRCQITVGMTTTITGHDEMALRVEAHNDVAGATGNIYLKNWNSGQFDILGTYTVPAVTDSEFWIRSIPTANYINPTTGRIEVRLEHIRALPLPSTFLAGFDQVKVMVGK